MIAVLDIETGGFSKEKHAICQIGLLIIDKQDNVVKEISLLIEPYGKEYSEKAFEIHGLSEEELLIKGIEPYEACNILVKALNRNGVRELIGHNIRKFDFPFIQNFLDEFLFELDEEEFIITDTLEQARKEDSERKNDLISLSESFGLDTENAHDAIKDCYLTYNIYKLLQW